MKKTYSFSLIFLAFLCVLYPFLNLNKEQKQFFKSESNNLEKIIPESINPNCNINENNNYELKIVELEYDLKRIQKQLDYLCY